MVQIEVVRRIYVIAVGVFFTLVGLFFGIMGLISPDLLVEFLLQRDDAIVDSDIGRLMAVRELIIGFLGILALYALFVKKTPKWLFWFLTIVITTRETLDVIIIGFDVLLLVLPALILNLVAVVLLYYGMKKKDIAFF